MLGRSGEFGYPLPRSNVSISIFFFSLSIDFVSNVYEHATFLSLILFSERTLKIIVLSICLLSKPLFNKNKQIYEMKHRI